MAVHRQRALAPPGTGRLGIVSGYFRFAGFAGVLGTLVLTVSYFFGESSEQMTPSNPVLALGGAALMTFGFFHTSRLLEQRRKGGAHLASICFAAPLIGYLTGAAPSLSTLILSGIGLSLVASVWRHLE